MDDKNEKVALFDLRPWKIVSLFVNENVYQTCIRFSWDETARHTCNSYRKSNGSFKSY